MSKTKWYSKVLSLAIAISFALSLIVLPLVGAAPADVGEESEWTDVNTPSAADFVIAINSDIYDFAICPDGATIYAVGMGLDEDAVTCDADNVTARLWKSEDGGVTWEDITQNLADEIKGEDELFEARDEVYLVDVAPDNCDIVVVTGLVAEGPFVATSADGGDSFCDSEFPGEVTNAGDILCMDLSMETEAEEYNIAVGTDTGKVLRFEMCSGYCPSHWELAGGYEAGKAVYPGWDNSDEDGLFPDFTTVAVTSVAFSPNFADDDTILAVTTEGHNTYLQTGLWGDTEAWNEEAEDYPDAILIVNAPPDGVWPGVTGIALPEDYTGYDEDLRYSWVYVNYDDEGHVFEIDGVDAEAADIDCGPNQFSDDGYPLLASISMTGTIDDGALMVGAMGPSECCEGVQVYRTGDWPIYLCCPDWERADKLPTGLFRATVAYSPDGSKAYAATMGDSCADESAFSVSGEVGEVGEYWNQLSLIDTNIDYLSDVAVNPVCGTIYLASINEACGCACDSVWLSRDEGDSYMRVWSGALDGNNGLLRFNPEETEKIDNIYLVDQRTKVVYWNDNGGLTDWDDRTAPTLSDIVDFAVLNESTVYAVSSEGEVAKSEHNASRWLSAEDADLDLGTHEYGHTIAILGDYVLVGGTAGQVSYSDDAGETFTALDDVDVGDYVHVAFDSYFADNGVVYAASGNEEGGGIYICEDLEVGEWDDVEARGAYDPDEDDVVDAYYNYYGIVLGYGPSNGGTADSNPMTDADTGGVLYAVYNIVDGPEAGHITGSGMARLLGAYAQDYDFDYLVEGTDDVDDDGFINEPSALKLCGCLTEDSNSLLWVIDAQGYDLEAGENNLFVYEDCLSKAGVTVTEVADGSMVDADGCNCWNAEFVLKWDEICDSDTYALQMALDEDFDYIVTLDGFTKWDSDEEAVCGIGNEYLFTPTNTLECARTYYWKVRVIEADDEAIQSWWSPVWSFTVEAGPGAAIQLTYPDAGASNVPIAGVVFTWTTVAGATSYDFILKDADGVLVGSATIDAPSTSCGPVGLDYDTTYLWTVTALKDSSTLSPSSESTFSTVAAAVVTCPQCGLTFPSQEALQAHIAEAHAPVVPTTPAWVWVVIGLGAVLVIAVIVLIFRTRRV